MCSLPQERRANTIKQDTKQQMLPVFPGAVHFQDSHSLDRLWFKSVPGNISGQSQRLCKRPRVCRFLSLGWNAGTCDAGAAGEATCRHRVSYVQALTTHTLCGTFHFSASPATPTLHMPAGMSLQLQQRLEGQRKNPLKSPRESLPWEETST